MISNDTLNKIIEEAQKEKLFIKVRDVSYVILCNHFEDNTVAYISLYGNADKAEIDKYDKCAEIAYIKKIIGKYIGKKRKSKESDITFEENKAYMLKLKKETEDAMANGEIDKKDGLKILSDISVKLNDKFSVTEDVKEQLVVVNTKYSDICEYCGHELYIPTKEDLMKKYNLIENTKPNE